MTIYRSALNRASDFHRSILVLQQRCINDTQRKAIADVLTVIEKMVLMIEASPSLKETDKPCRSAFNFGGLIHRGDSLSTVLSRERALRSAASAWGKRHNVQLGVAVIKGVSVVCTRLDGPERAPGPDEHISRDLGEIAGLIDRSPRPVDPVTQLRTDNPPVRVRDDLDDPETADDVRAAMAIPEGDRTDWQQVIVEDYQHLIEFEKALPSVEVVQDALLVDSVNRTPRQAWLVAHHLHLLD